MPYAHLVYLYRARKNEANVLFFGLSRICLLCFGASELVGGKVSGVVGLGE